MHPIDATKRGLQQGPVTVKNHRGSFVGELTVDDSVRPGVIAATKGRWGVGVNQVTSALPADMASGAIFHDAAIEVLQESAAAAKGCIDENLADDQPGD